jgi:hypothetical protein
MGIFTRGSILGSHSHVAATPSHAIETFTVEGREADVPNAQGWLQGRLFFQLDRGQARCIWTPVSEARCHQRLCWPRH